MEHTAGGGPPEYPDCMQKLKRIGILTGGGDCPGLNAVIRAAARTLNHAPDTEVVGIQFGFTRDAVSSDVAAGRVTSVQFEPGVVYALFDRANDYVWIRPYVGSVVSFRHETLSATGPVALETTSENGVGFRVFGGGEMTFGSMPRFGLSADLGYRRLPTPFPGFEASPLSASIAVHWYMK